MAECTPGPWSVPHFACDDCPCNCGYVLSEHQHGMGAIATVHFSTEGQDWREGDHEPLEVAKANARLIAAAPTQHDAARGIDRLSLVILSAVKTDQPGQYDAVVAAILANRAAIASATRGETAA